ncbi:MAG: aminotransferase class V-fold PLP-dependent enzyme [Anaerolineae bacterium]|nr:aminotransferase class V-fold PLP-dependent enzyme [Anaerolineae bacterium]
MRDLFLIDPSVTFLNHGSFGACPAEVFAVYQDWQRQLEWQPVEFIARRSESLLGEAREAIGAYLCTDPANLIFVPNATHGVNVVARSLQLQAGDQILTTDHEYGACEYTWTFTAQRVGAEIVRQHIPLPLPDPAEFVELFWSKVTPRTRVIFISHITSVTALIFPIAEICARARARGIITVIDGAHVPGHLPLNLDELGADFYTGNFHKWLCAPKGAAFLYVAPQYQAITHPLVISWGYGSHTSGLFLNYSESEPFMRRAQIQGTQDLAAYLSVPAAIAFQTKHAWPEIRARCHALAVESQTAIDQLTGLAPIAPPSAFGQMIAIRLPASVDPIDLKARLYDEYRIEIPITGWNGLHLIRPSYQAYNTHDDLTRLLTALTVLLQ